MLHTLNVASSGLASSREQIENIMNNIANENTPGYKKRVVNISEAEHSDDRLTGRGSLIGDTSRVTFNYMHDNLMTQTARKSQYNELSGVLSNIEAIFFETEDSGMSADLDRYFKAVENLRTTPNNEVYKNELVSTGKILVNDIKELYHKIELEENAVRTNIDEKVSEVNSKLERISSLNKKIRETNRSTNEMLDKRDWLEEDISTYLDTTVGRSDFYSVNLSSEIALVNDNGIHDVTTKTNLIAQKDVYGTTSDPIMSTLINDATWQDTGDKVSFKLNNTTSISVEFGEVVDGHTVNRDNLINAIMFKINNNPDMSSKLTAYNGQYIVNKEGEKILTDNPEHPFYDVANPNKERYLIIESNIPGDIGKFSGRILVEDANHTIPALNLDKNGVFSKKGTDEVYLDVLDHKLYPKSGKLKPLLDNLTTNSSNNLFVKYKEKLDEFAKSLSNITSSYIENDDGSYVYGVENVDINANSNKRVDIKLFSGGTVESLKFHEDIAIQLNQQELEYLSTIQWKDDVDIDGSGNNLMGFSEFNQYLRAQVAKDKEDIDLKKETQDAVTLSIQHNYEKLTKVDKDEEMINLIKFQAAYTANAKIVTIIDEMLVTILGMKR